MTEKPKFEFQINKHRQNQHSETNEKQNLNNNTQKKAIVSHIGQKMEKVSDDEFFSNFDQMFIVDFNEQTNGNLGQFSCDVQNPQIQTFPNSKPGQNFERATLEQNVLSTSEDLEQEQYEDIQLQENTEIKQENTVGITTPQKFQKKLIFQDLDNSEQNCEYLWAPKKKIKKNISQSN